MNGAGLGLVLTSLEGDLIQQSIYCGFWTTNNEVEYKVLITGLSLATEMGILKLDICFDSQLVVNQQLGTYQARDSKMTSYLAHVKELQSTFEEFNISQVPKLENIHAHSLANLESAILVTTSQSIPLIYLQWLVVWKSPPTEVTIIDTTNSWMTPILHYLTHNELSVNKIEAQRLRAKVARFTILDGQLLKRSFSGPHLKCVTPDEADYILAKLHQGEFGHYAKG